MTIEEAIKELRDASDNEVRYGDTDNHYNEVMKRIEAFDIAIKALEQTRWIPCIERLPKTDEDVLVTNGRGVYVGWRYIGIDSTDRGWRVDSESEYFMDDIVAWMPLPPCYKPQESEEV